MRLIRRYLLLFACLVAPLIGQAASFDCGRANLPIEKQICSDEELSRLDDLLSTEYEAAAISLETRDRQKSEQRRWLGRRDACRTRNCIVDAYERRLLDLQRVNCLRDLATGHCQAEPPSRFPRTADGRLMLRTFGECRAAFDYAAIDTEMGENVNITADCIESGLVNSCEDSEGKWRDACAWAHVRSAERRIRAAEKTILSVLASTDEGVQIGYALGSSHQNWLAYREEYCRGRNERFDYAKKFIDEANRLAKDTSAPLSTLPDLDALDKGEEYLQCFWRVAKERAIRLELRAREIKSSNTSSSRQGLLKMLREDPLMQPQKPK